MGSILPIIEANRIDNLLIWMLSSAALCLLVYFILLPISYRLHISHTKSGEMFEIMERAKSRMGIDFEVDLRITEQEGYAFTSYRNLFYALIIMSSTAQSAMLQDSELGETIIANELITLKNTRPWRVVYGLVALCICGSSPLIVDRSFIELSEVYGYTAGFFIGMFPYILMWIGIALIDSAKAHSHISHAMTDKEYHVSPLLARMVLFEGYTITRTDFENKTKREIDYEHVYLEDNFEKVFVIFAVGGIVIFSSLWILSSFIGSIFEVDPVLSIVSFMFACIFAIILLCFGVARKYNILDDSRSRPYYQLESSNTNGE